MAVTLISDDLIYPTGELQDGMFPNGDLGESVDTWLSASEAQGAGSDLVARHWVYYRGYDAIANRLANTPASISVDGAVTRTVSSAQITFYRNKADSNLSEWNRLSGGDQFAATKPVKFSVF